MIDPKAEGNSPAATPRTRMRARHILDNYYIGPSRSPEVLEIWAYTEKFTYRPGETVGLRVSTTAERWDLEIGRDGAKYELVLSDADLQGQHHDTPQDCSVEGCEWPVAYEFTIPQDWKPGGYLITLRARRGDDAVEEHHLILVRGRPDQNAAPYVLVCATGTWVAYNCWGGSNAYEGITGPENNEFSPVLSTQRPWTRGFCRLPDGAPRGVPETPQAPGDMVRYPYMEWAYAYGYSKKYASAGWASYERHFARWAEAQGFDFDFATQHDLERDPDLLKRHACAVFVGHDEYWSSPMRDAVDSFLDGGGRVARFGGNFLWQIRLENEGRTQVCYKYNANERDPLYGTERANLVTGPWDAAPVNRPGASTFAVNGLKGVYAGLGRCAGQGSGGFTVYRPRHWAFEGAHIGYGDVLGSRSRILGYEVDGLDHVIEDGLPYPTGTDGADLSIEILALSPASNTEPDFGVWGEIRYIGGEDTGFKAQSLFGDSSPESLERAERGNGVIASWKRGAGEVFTAATCEWVMGLARRDWQVEQVTHTVLKRFGVID